jgi:hypothetical protein
MKYQGSMRFEIDTDTPEAAAQAFVQSLYERLVRTHVPIEVAITAVRQGTVFLYVTPDVDAPPVDRTPA